MSVGDGLDPVGKRRVAAARSAAFAPGDHRPGEAGIKNTDLIAEIGGTETLAETAWALIDVVRWRP